MHPSRIKFPSVLYVSITSENVIRGCSVHCRDIVPFVGKAIQKIIPKRGKGILNGRHHFMRTRRKELSLFQHHFWIPLFDTLQSTVHILPDESWYLLMHLWNPPNELLVSLQCTEHPALCSRYACSVPCCTEHTLYGVITFRSLSFETLKISRIKYGKAQSPHAK